MDGLAVPGLFLFMEVHDLIPDASAIILPFLGLCVTHPWMLLHFHTPCIQMVCMYFIRLNMVWFIKLIIHHDHEKRFGDSQVEPAFHSNTEVLQFSWPLDIQIPEYLFIQRIPSTISFQT